MLSALGTHSLHVLHITMFAEIHCSKSVKQLIGLHHGLQPSGAPLRRSLRINCRRFSPRFLFIEVPGQGAFHPPTTRFRSSTTCCLSRGERIYRNRIWLRVATKESERMISSP